MPFPKALAERALFLSESRGAWNRRDLSAVVEWITGNGFAIISCDIRVTRDGKPVWRNPRTGADRYGLVCACVNRDKAEVWGAYVERALRETVELATAKDVSAIAHPEPSEEVYFDISWVSEIEHRRLLGSPDV